MYKEIDDLYHEASLHSGLSNSAHLILYSIAELGYGCLQIEIANTYSISKQTVVLPSAYLKNRAIFT